MADMSPCRHLPGSILSLLGQPLPQENRKGPSVRILPVARLSAGRTSPEGPHSSPPLQRGLARIRMCTSRPPEALWPIERLARLSTVTCSFRTVSEVTLS